MNSIYDFIRTDWKKEYSLTVIEIGCATMDDTIRMLGTIDQLGMDYEYYAFEPDPRNVEKCQNSSDFTRVHFTAAAVGDANKRVQFNQSSGKNPTYGYDHTISGSVKAPVQHLSAHPWCKFESKVEVPMMRLDDFARLWSIGVVDFIWCDVQGAEDLVITGAQEVLSRTRYFYTEYYENEMYKGQIGIQEMLRRLPGGVDNWEIVHTWPNDVLFMNTELQDKV
ncbi:MAG: FkbM family methyltransferase [Planctomycetota bacterium]|jgi:FkbM family methyltransferase